MSAEILAAPDAHSPNDRPIAESLEEDLLKAETLAWMGPVATLRPWVGTTRRGAARAG